MSLDPYPTEAEITEIKDKEVKSLEDFHELMESVRVLWWPDGAYGWKREGDIYYISTCGWSGNEEIIGAMKENMMFWLMYWGQSRRGGHYIFCPMGVDF